MKQIDPQQMRAHAGEAAGRSSGYCNQFTVLNWTQMEHKYDL